VHGFVEGEHPQQKAYMLLHMTTQGQSHVKHDIRGFASFTVYVDREQRAYLNESQTWAGRSKTVDPLSVATHQCTQFHLNLCACLLR
jgi:hypothetical protein